MKKAKWFFLVLVVAGSASCRVSDNGLAFATNPGAGSGGVSGTGGTQDAGAEPAGTGGRGAGGIAGSGGRSGSGGLPAVAGAVGSAGSLGSGGITTAGGAIDSGVAMATGGAAAPADSMATGGVMASGGAIGTDGAAGAGGSPNPDGAKDRADVPSGDAPSKVPPDTAAGSPPDSPIDRRTIDVPLIFADARAGANDTVADGGSPMTLVWSDEFEGAANTGVDATKWNYVTWDPGQVNNEEQKYTSRLQNVFQDGSGHLVLRGLDTPYAGNKYTSGRIESSGHFEFKFGRVEVRAKLPAGIGSFPGIIAMGTTGTWPQCGELALVEQYGQDKSWFYTSANAGSAGGSGTTGNVKYTFPNTTTASSDFHVYSLDWYADTIVFQVDGVEITRTSFATTSPFYAIPEYLVLDLALGGNMGGTMDANAFPMDMVVDYVRVYSF